MSDESFIVQFEDGLLPSLSETFYMFSNPNMRSQDLKDLVFRISEVNRKTLVNNLASGSASFFASNQERGRFWASNGARGKETTQQKKEQSRLPHTRKDKGAQPIKCKPYRVSDKEREIINKKIEEMLEDEIIELSTSPRCLPVVLAKKKDEHLQKLRKVFPQIRDAGSTLQPDKCVYLKQEVEMLGFKVGANGIKVDEKIERFVNFPVPRKVKDIQSFLGMCNYYKKFIKNYAVITRPLHKATKKDRAWEWTEE
ncbi:hypothetical protein TcasGA2_TC015861 [Tribolium castaneum]|uniref:RNA-directed DNA polymerase n=1 Tax=Tribolium castaneum TaxID=7070 RepID=D2A4D3_TRICA|nr:hypothetical protein TcasGA2_TC015861 [Tribolium castaneum]